MCKFHRKTPVLESLFNKAAGLKACSTKVFFCEICENFKSTYYEQHLRTTPFNTFAFKDCFGKIILHACSYVWSILKDYVKNCDGVYVCWTCNWWKKMSKIQTNKGSILNINVLNVLLSIFDINECSKIRNTGNIGNDQTMKTNAEQK